jgi:hypothetical protein
VMPSSWRKKRMKDEGFGHGDKRGKDQRE